MRIIADNREPIDAVIGHLRADDQVQLSFGHLPMGDYLVENRLLFERKTLSDFAISLCDGRLFKQAIGMVNSRFRPYLILEGESVGVTLGGHPTSAEAPPRGRAPARRRGLVPAGDGRQRVGAATDGPVDPHGLAAAATFDGRSPLRPPTPPYPHPPSFASSPPAGISRDSALGAMVTLSVVMGIPILRTRDPAETARLLIFAGEQLARRATGAVSRPGYRPKGLRKRQVFVLQGLPGVGRKRAEALLDHYHTPAAVLAATEEDLAGVAGIGRTTAKAIRRIAHVDASAESAAK